MKNITQLKHAFEFINSPIFLFDENHSLIFINQYTKQQFYNNDIEAYSFNKNKEYSTSLSNDFSIVKESNSNRNIVAPLSVDNKNWETHGSLWFYKDFKIYIYSVFNYFILQESQPYSNNFPLVSINICSHLFTILPLEIYFINNEGKIIHKTPFAEKINNTKNEGFIFKTLYDINPNFSAEWWNEIKYDLKDKKYLVFETDHNYSTDVNYKMFVSVFSIIINNETIFCYQCNDINMQYEVEKSLIKEVAINKNLTELSSELAKNQQLEYIQLLVRQYALEITSSSFAFISYHDPDKQKLTFSIYNDTGTDYTNEITEIEQKLTRDYYTNSIKAEYLLNQQSKFYIEEKSIFEMLPFKNILITQIEGADDLMGFIFVANQEYEYTDEDAENLKSLSNLFAVAINRTIKNNTLKESLEQLNLALDVANMTIFDANFQDRSIKISPSWQKRFEKLFKNNIPSLQNLIKYIHKEDLITLIKEIKKQSKLKSSNFKTNIRVKEKGDNYSWFMITGKAISYNEYGKIKQITGLAMDITDMVLLNEEIIKSREIAIEANKAKSTFLARITHELRTPLNSIIGFADFLIGNLNDNLHLSYMNNIKQSGILLLDLINDILDFSKIEAGKTTLQNTKTNIIQLINEIQVYYQHLIVQKDLKFYSTFDKNLPTTICIDQLRIRQVISNLISNAIKFTDKGEVSIEVRSTKTNDNEITLIFVVNDTGIGIKESSQKTIFDDFTQQADQDNRKYGGTGLGLGIVKSIVTMLKGEILLESTSGVGSTFTVVLPNIEVLDDSEINEPRPLKLVKKHSKTTIEDNSQIILPNDLFTKEEKQKWDDFKNQPSFNNVPIIVEILRNIKKDEYIAICEKTATKLEEAVAIFDVEKLNMEIRNFEKEITNVRKQHK